MKLTKKQNIKISIVITFITMIVSLILHFFYTPFLLKHIGDRQNGLLGFATSSLSWLTIAVNAILAAYNKMASEEVAKDPSKGEERTNSVYTLIVIIWSAIIAIFSSIFIMLLAFNVIDLSKYSDSEKHTILILFILVSISMIFTVATKVANLNIIFNNKHIWVKTSALIVTLLYPLASIPFIIAGCDIITIATIQVVVNMLASIFDIFYDRFILKKRINFRILKNERKFIKHIFAFSSIILINELAYQLDCSVDNIILGFKGLSEQITLYQLALIIVTAISNCTSMVYTPFIPTVYSNEANGNREANLKLYDLITFIQLLLWFFVFGGFLACGKEFVIIWIGRERLIVFYICLSLLIIRSLSCCQGPSKDMMRASGKHLHRAILAMVAAILNSLVSFILVYFVFDDSNAIWGCIIGTATASVICWCIICNFMSYKYLKINIKLYCCNFLLLCLLSFVCALIPIVLKTYVFSHWINNTTLTFLISGFIFVFLFLGLCILLFKKRIKEIYFLLRSK